MKDCNGCKYAVWKRNENGRLHRSGDGECTFRYRLPELPNSLYWISKPSPTGGYFINRRKVYDKHCPYYTPKN